MKSKHIPWLLLVVLATVLLVAPGAVSCVIVGGLVAAEMLAWAVYRMGKKNGQVDVKEPPTK